MIKRQKSIPKKRVKPRRKLAKKVATVRVLSDGREVINTKSKSGQDEYKRRTLSVWQRDKGVCGWCELPVSQEEVTADHIQSRGMGGSNRDDRESNLRPCHLYCNSERSSSPILTRKEWLENKRNNR